MSTQMDDTSVLDVAATSHGPATRALAVFGVYGQPGDEENTVLDLADEFRQRLCGLHQEYHEANTEFRNTRFPALWNALVQSEAAFARIVLIEREIKKHHSDVGDRNAVTPDQRERLEAARAEHKAAMEQVRAGREAWSDFLKRFRTFFAGVQNWKNVKTLAKRRDAYHNIQWPEEFSTYGPIILAIDLQIRELGEEYQDRGLHSAIRAEIVEASAPKIGKTGPGMRYRYGRQPRPKPWEKLTLQFAGGITLEKLIAGRCPQLRVAPLYVKHPRGGDETVVECVQQIGNSEYPRYVTYVMKFDRSFPDDAVIQRWSLVVRTNGKREVIPIVRSTQFGKPIGEGVLTYDLTWTVKQAGIQIAHFRGDHVNETLVLPNDIVNDRMCVKDTQQSCDLIANQLLENRGIPSSKQPPALHGISALEDYVEKNPADTQAANIYDNLLKRMNRAYRIAARARRCIEDIYRVVASRVCQLHSHIVVNEIKLAKIKKYKKRDLLRTDVIPPRSREIMAAVSPGKLQALLKGYGLEKTALEQAPETESTDLFTSWIGQLRQKTGTKPNLPHRRTRLRR